MKKYALFALLLAGTLFACKKHTGNAGPNIVVTSFTPSKGNSGISITISGENFDTTPGNNTVAFSGGTATAYGGTTHTLYVIVPPGVATGKISISAHGRGTGTSKDDFEVLTGGTWSQKASFPEPAPPNGRGLGVGFAINGKGYMGLGTDNGIDFKDLYEYNPATDKWTAKASAEIGMETVVSFVINNKAYVGIGQSRGLAGNTNRFFEYDPATDKWTEKAIFPG